MQHKRHHEQQRKISSENGTVPTFFNATDVVAVVERDVPVKYSQA
jgi:hypothetical protein